MQLCIAGPDGASESTGAAGDLMSDFSTRLKRVGVMLGLAGCLLAPACDDEPAAPTTERRADAPTELSGQPLQRGRVLGGEKVQRAVQWPAAESLDTGVRDQLDQRFRDALASSPLPVLVPRNEEMLRNAELYKGEHWIAIAAKTDEVAVSLNASGLARVYPHISKTPLPHMVRGGEGLVTQNETIWSASWIENGVAYDLSVECIVPTMPQCQDSSYTEDLVSTLAFVGGREVR